MKRLMVVDDESEICDFLKLFFEDRRFQVTTAFSGIKALEVLEQVNPHVVLMDIHMPGMDGISALREIKKRMDKIKGGQEALLSYVALTAIGTLPKKAQDVIINVFNNNATSTMTNVPGPKSTLYLANEPIKNIMFFGPQSGNMGVGISILSYDGQVTLGVSADANLIKYPQDLVDGFQKDLDQWFNTIQRP